MDAPGCERESEFRLFVYGSLKRGYRLHHYLNSQRWLGNALTEPDYRLYDCGSYPALVKATKRGRAIHGEVYAVQPGIRTVLDEVEGVAEGLYVLENVRLQPPFNDPVVYAYFYARSVEHLVDCGNIWPPKDD